LTTVILILRRIVDTGDTMLQVFPDAPDQQAGHGVHGPGDVRLGAVPAALLGLLPRRRLLPQTV